MVAKTLQSTAALVFLGAMSALCKALSLQTMADSSPLVSSKPLKSQDHNGTNKQQSLPTALTEHQQVLIGMNVGNRKMSVSDRIETESPSDTNSSKQRSLRVRPTTTLSPSPQSALLVPLHQPTFSKTARPSVMGSSLRSGMERHDSSTGRVSSLSPVGANAVKGSPFRVIPYGSSIKSQTPPSDMQVSPWAKQKSPVVKENIASEEKLEEFLVDVEEKMIESAIKAPAAASALVTPPPTLRGAAAATPSSGPTPIPRSSTPGSAPLRPLRMSPGSQKYGTSPRKSEGDLPQPMSMEQATEAFRKLGLYPQIEHWRDKLRQWFSKTLLNPLVSKLDSSHIQVMQAAAKLGLSITVTQVGGSKQDTRGPSMPSIDITSHEWLTTFSPDEDALLHQLRAALVQGRDAPAPQPTLFGLNPVPHMITPINAAIQDCLDAITEHQRLQALMKGEWAKGLLPQSTVRPDYTVQRIRELAEGTCVKKFEYLGSGEVHDKTAKRWMVELPTDSHLLVYLFCALLEHPQWMLHVDPTPHLSTPSSNNPMFVASMPPKERFPEKYVAVLSTVPVLQHMGACILVVGKQSPPVFALYWDKTLQFSFQGRTALWDAIIMLCHRIKVAHSGMIRGISLGSSGLNLLSVLETEVNDGTH
eukprot:c25477_g1_i1 orf=509-2443(-)